MYFRITVPKVWIVVCMAVLSSRVWAGQRPAAPTSEPGIRIIVVPSASQAQTILDQLKQGRDFAELAKATSSDPTAADGGYMGRPDPATLCPELRDTLKGVSAGQFTGIVQVPGGYAILKILPESEVPQRDPNSAPLPSVTSACALRPAILVSGFGEADTIFRNFPKPDGWERDLRQICAIRKESISIVQARLDRALDPRNPALTQ